MVTQVLADAGNILDHTDPERTQLACGPDPGAHEDGRGVKCPRAEADLPPLIFGLSARGSDPYARCASSVEDDPIYEGVTDDGEVGTTARGLEIAVIRRHAPTSTAVHGIRGDAGAVRHIVVLCPGIAQVQGRRPEGAIERAPMVDRGAVHGDGSPARMVWSFGEIKVILEATKGREHFSP